MDKDQYLQRLVLKLETHAPLPLEEREKLLELPLTLRRFEAGQDIVGEGERTKQCCLVAEGLVCRYKIAGEGGRQILSLHLPGDIPDVHSLLIEWMDHSLGTLTQAVVGFIPHDAVRSLTRSSYRISEALWRETLIEASIYREWMVGIGRRSAPSRIAHLLCEFLTKMTAIGLADVWQWTPLIVILVYAALLTQDPAVREAASLDGAHGIRLFQHITWPAIAGTVVAAFFIRLVIALKVFDLVFVMTSGGPGQASTTTTYLIQQVALKEFDIGRASAITIVFAVIVTAVTLVVAGLARKARHE